ncbi:EAL domain-containing protein [uncultured Massilia sp.]|uniref:EAL domain-containing protein n=1 Tax=uncultured Massilia sp. TaxID=169973 RepID=UPI0025F6E260|nr:EAL domain-containing protein [uncultured Massilia sp.]
MRSRIGLGLTVLAATGALLVPPWLAWREARRQAWESESAAALAYARDVMHRTDDTARQIVRATSRMNRSGLAPCSPAALALMRDIALSSSYLQAVGYVRDGALACSSLGTMPLPLGGQSFRTASGAVLYPHVPTGASASVLAAQLGDYAALMHQELPVDATAAPADVALGVLHLEQHRTAIARGAVDVAWIDRLGARRAATFVDGGRLVVVVRSKLDTIAAVAAMPAGQVERRAREIAARLVPAGLLCGIAACAAVVLFARRRRSIEAAIGQALRRNEFFVLYQPIVNLQTGEWVGAEALLRWRRADGELVGPDAFIPVAEQTGLIVRLTERVVRLVGEDAGRFLAEHPGFHIAINLSAADMHSPAIVDHLAGMLARCGARASNLMVEITERGFLRLDAAQATVAALRKRGIAVAIDDFGTGYSSLSYLQRLDLDYLKIDRAFVETIGTDAPTSGVVGMIIDMARTMRLTMVAEGIESPAQAAYLRERGVEFAQGWLFGKPMPFADIAARMTETRREAA